MSIIGESLARVGSTFIYEGEQPECAPCKLRKVCHQGLARHGAYRVTAVRPVQHDCCPLFEGRVTVVSVEPTPVRVTIPVAAAKGSAFTKKWVECGAKCTLKKYCDPAAFAEGTTLTLDEVGGDVPCLVGRKLKFARAHAATVKKG